MPTPIPTKPPPAQFPQAAQQRQQVPVKATPKKAPPTKNPPPSPFDGNLIPMPTHPPGIWQQPPQTPQTPQATTQPFLPTADNLLHRLLTPGGGKGGGKGRSGRSVPVGMGRLGKRILKYTTTTLTTTPTTTTTTTN
jgi:hypothetical protein